MNSGQPASGLDATHDPALESWVETANDPLTDFPIQNLPIGIATPRGEPGRPRPVVAIGDHVMDLRAARDARLLAGIDEALLAALGRPALNGVMSVPAGARRSLRRRLSELLDARTGAARAAAPCLLPLSDVEMRMPAEVGDYTDFYASIFHATNLGRMFRPDNPLLPNYKFVPIGYHGRASSIVPSGSPIRRPAGQTRAEGAAVPAFGPTARLDYELELGLFVGAGNVQGEPIPIDDVAEHEVGLCLVNDWSARDVQAWEYQPLGPFLGKSFATTISPWVATFEALAPFRAPAFARPDGDPPPLPYLDSPAERAQGGLDLTLEVLLASRRMRETGCDPARVSLVNASVMYWTFGQLLAHHASNGCNLRPGDLLASGTLSGPTDQSRGSLIERAWRGTTPFPLPGGEARRFLEDGDEVIMRGWCERDGFRRIGFGECRGIVTPAGRDRRG
jgi:fumarylacetoacetase